MGWFNNIALQMGLYVVPDTILALIGLAMLLFLWGLAKFILRAGDEKAVEEGKKLMVWGLVALTVMVSVWGLVQILRTMTAANSNTVTVPQVINPF